MKMLNEDEAVMLGKTGIGKRKGKGGM